METNPDIAKGVGKFGSSKRNQKECWEQFAVDLNSLGPPTREGKDWHKVWLDYKLKLKQKIAGNKKNVTATGGGPYCEISLTPLEQAVDNLLSLSQAVNPTGNCFGASTAAPLQTANLTSGNTPSVEDQINENLEEQILNNDDTQLHQNINAIESEHDHGSTVPQNSSQSSNRVTNSDAREGERLKMLKEQTDTQANLFKVAKTIENHLSEITRYTRKQYEIEKEKVNIMRAKEKRKEKENVEKNRRHKEIIEIKLKKIEVEMRKAL